MDTPMAILMILIFGTVIVISLRLLVGSTKKRVQEKIAIQKYENYKEACKDLDRLKENKNIHGIIEYLHHPDTGIRSNAVHFLGIFKDPCAVEPLCELLKDNNLGDIQVKQIIRTLKRIGNSSVEPMISVIANVHSSSYVRKELAKALGELGNSNAVKPLIAILKDEKWRVRGSAAKALKKITGYNFGQDGAKWQKWSEDNEAKYRK